jgi:hypothetical protein
VGHDEFDKDDLPLINRVLGQHPEVREVLVIAKQAIQQGQFPLASFDALAAALGGEDATFPFRGHSVRVGDLRQGIPAYYFPITSVDDLIAKIADLRLRASEPAAMPEVALGEQIPLPEGLKPPDLPPPPPRPQGGFLGIPKKT